MQSFVIMDRTLYYNTEIVMTVFAIALDLANLQQQSKINGFIRAVSLLSELNMMREKEQEPQNNIQIINRQHLLQFYHPCWLNAATNCTTSLV